jgi:hypothetical protein
MKKFRNGGTCLEDQGEATTTKQPTFMHISWDDDNDDEDLDPALP